MILVVDDIAISRLATVFAVQGFGYDTDEANSGLAGLAKATVTTYAAIIMDCIMPDMDGMECTARIRELEKATGLIRTPIIGFTSQEMSPAERVNDFETTLEINSGI